MPDPFTVTTNESWGSRLVNSIKSVIFGFVLFVVAFPLLFWNEGRAVQTARSLEEGADTQNHLRLFCGRPKSLASSTFSNIS